MIAPLSRIRRAWERARTVPGMGRDVVALAALVVLGLAAVGTILAKQRVEWPWDESFTFRADFRAAPGISPGNGQEVRIAGVTVGEIREADVTDEGRARLTLAIEPGHAVYENARLVLRPKTPLNDMYVEMNPGGPPSDRLSTGDVIPVTRTEEPVQVDQVLQHLDSRARAALSSLLGEADAALARAPSHLPEGLEAAGGLLSELRPVVQAIETRRHKIATLVSHLSQISAAVGEDDQRLARLVTSLRGTLGVVASRDDELESAMQQLPGFTSDLGRAATDVRRLTGELDPTLQNVRRASQTLPSALRKLTESVAEIRQTARTARPVVREVRPVVADMRPFVPHVSRALHDTSAVTGRLDRSTATVVSYLTDLQAFVYNTTSILSLEDANGGILRGQIQFSRESLPVKGSGADR